MSDLRFQVAVGAYVFIGAWGFAFGAICAAFLISFARNLLRPERAASGTLTEGGDVEQAPSDSLSGPTGNAGDAQGGDHA